MTTDAFFRMTVADVFFIRGRGTVVTGQIESGTLKVGDEIQIARADGTRLKAHVAGIEMLRKIVSEANAGDSVGVLLRDVQKQDVQRGAVLVGA